MPFNSTKVDTTSKVIANTGGNFEGVNIFNGATASVVYICDNILNQELQVSTYNNDPTVTVENSALLTVGDLVTGNGIPADTRVLSITNGTTIELTASTTGGNGTSGGSGAGGNGLASSITGSSVTRTGGGGGGVDDRTNGYPALGGTGGGGDGGDKGQNGSAGNVRYASSGTINTGSGGGGGGVDPGNANERGKSGGSGIVILRYPNTVSITVGAGLSAGTETTDGSDKYIEITGGVGTVSWS